MYAKVLVDSGAPETVVTVPQTAVTYSLYGDNVFVVVPAKKLDPNAKDEEQAESSAASSRPVRSATAACQIVSGLSRRRQRW